MNNILVPTYLVPVETIPNSFQFISMTPNLLFSLAKFHLQEFAAAKEAFQNVHVHDSKIFTHLN